MVECKALKRFYDPKELIGKTVVVSLASLQPYSDRETIQRVTKMQAITERAKYWLHSGFQVGGMAHAKVEMENQDDK
jgi:hypothetical protein